MSIEIHTDLDPATWNEYVDRSPNASPFHRHEALELLASEVDMTLHMLSGFKGEEPVGVLPLFEGKQGPFTMVWSPPKLEVFTLGPALLNFGNLKQRKADQRQWRFVEAAIDWLDDHLEPDYVDLRTTDEYVDMRPFIWNHFDVSPSYTYVLDIDRDLDAILESVTRDARSNITSARDEGVLTVDRAGRAGIPPVIERVRERHETQGEEYPIRTGFVEGLYDVLPESGMHVYTVEADGEVVTGMVTLETAETIYRWQGGAKAEAYPGANDLLDWRIIEDASARGLRRYDLVGANDRRISRYKAKFNPEPVPYYVAQRRRPALKAATEILNRLPDAVRVR